MKYLVFLFHLMVCFSLCFSYIYYECTYMSSTGEITQKTCGSCCEHDCCPEKPIDGKTLAIILCCCIGIPAIVVALIIFIAIRARRKRQARLQARLQAAQAYIAARDLQALFLLAAAQPDRTTTPVSEPSSSFADPPRYDDVVNGQSTLHSTDQK